MLPPRNIDNDCRHIIGEVWKVSDENLQGLDEYEGMRTENWREE
jgi:hypothetical protein